MLRDCLATPLAEARQRLRAAYDAIPGHEQRPLILFGCGPLGRRTAAALALAGRAPVAFADNNSTLWATLVDGVPVLQPSEAVERYGETAIFAVTIYNGARARAQLRELGAVYVLHLQSLYQAMPDALLPWCALEEPDVILESVADIMRAAALWTDERSRAEFEAQLTWHLGLGSPPLPPHDPPEDCYFSSDLISLGSDTLFVDCGAFDGDSLRQLLRRAAAVGGYFGIEPDPANYARLSDFVGGLPPQVSGRIAIKNCALGAAAGHLRFAAAGSVASSLSQDGDIEAEVCTLDDLLRDQTPGIIKMDIEGAELDTLRGAARTLCESMPALAISAYHRVSDLWQIPLLIHALEPRYELHLRRYAEDCWETVCYAVRPQGEEA